MENWLEACKMMVKDPFVRPYQTSTGVKWQPTDYKPMDQAPYLDYLSRQVPQTVDLAQFDPSELRVKSVGEDERGLIIVFELTSQEKHGS